MPALGRPVTGGVFGAGVAAAVKVIVAQVPGFTEADGFAAAGAAGLAGFNQGG